MGKIKEARWFLIISALFLLLLGVGLGCGGQGEVPSETGNATESEATLLSNRILEFLTLSVSQEFSSSPGTNSLNGLISPFGSKAMTGPAGTCPTGSLSPMACPKGGSISVQSPTCSSEEDGSVSVCGTVDFSECQDFSAAGCPILEGPVEFCLNLSDTSTLRFFSRGNPLQTSSCDDSPGFQVLLQASCTFPVQSFIGNPVVDQCADHRIILKGESGCLLCTEGSCLTDGDCDEVVDVADNCPVNFNPRQNDTDGDGVGEVCEPFLPGGVDCSSRSCEVTEECRQIVRFCSEGESELGPEPFCCDGTCLPTSGIRACPPGTCPDFSPKHCQFNADCGELAGCLDGCCQEGFAPPPCFCECPPEAGPDCVVCPPELCTDCSCECPPGPGPECVLCPPEVCEGGPADFHLGRTYLLGRV